MSELPLHMYRACRPDFNGPRSDDRPFGLGTGGIRETTKECEHVGEREKDGGQEGGEKGDRESEREREREREIEGSRPKKRCTGVPHLQKNAPL